MDTNIKKWPVLGLVLIILGALGGVKTIFLGITKMSFLDLGLGITEIVIFWNLYKFQPWSRIALTVLLSLNIAIYFVLALGGVLPLGAALVVAVINGLIIYYFNSSKVKVLFDQK